MIGRAAWGLGILVLGFGMEALAQDEGTRIRLPNRSVDPEPGIEQELLSILGEPAPPGGVPAILQFLSLPSMEERDRLERSGIELRAYMGANAYVARIEGRRDLDAVPGLRWAGRFLPRDKIAPDLWKAVQQAPEPPDDKLRVVLYFETVTSPEDAQTVVGHFSSSARRYGPIGMWALEIRKADIERLASEASVSWVESLADDRLPLGAP